MAKTTITAGMTHKDVERALNNNFPWTNVCNPSTSLIDAINSNYDRVKAVDSTVPTKTTMEVGMSGANYIAALNTNCQNIDSVASHDEYNYVIPLHRGSEWTGLNDTMYYPVMIKLVNGKNLIGGLSRGGVTFSRENFAVVRAVDGTYSAPNLMGFEATTAGTYDSHSKATFIEKSGIIYAFHEELVGVSPDNQSGHGSEIIAKKSEDDGVTWSEITRFGLILSYAKVLLIAGNFYVVARELIAGISYITIYKSTNDCVDWTKLTSPYVADASYGSYHNIPAGDVAEINIVIYERLFLADHSAWPYFAHIRSTDGITYYNTDRTWSKDVVADGSITRTELVANCLISTYTGTDDLWGYNGGFIKNDKLYSLISHGTAYTTTGWATGLIRIVYSTLKIYEGTTVLMDLSSLLSSVEVIAYAPTGYLNFFRNGDTFDVLFIDVKNGNDIKLYNYNDTTLLSTKMLRLGELSAATIQMGVSQANVINRNDRIIVVGKITGSFLELIMSYTNWIIFEPK